MKKLAKKLRTSMAVNIIGVIVGLLLIYGLIVSAIGLSGFTYEYENEYSATTYHMADTATSLISGDHIEAYLDGRLKDEYTRTKRYLDGYCRKMNVSLVYVIAVDTSDYGRFVSVFNSVNNLVDNTTYSVWEIGYQRNTTNEEYRQKYRRIYEEGSRYETVYRYNPSDGSHPHITTMVPVRDSEGGVAAILCIQRPISELENAKRPFQIRIAVTTISLAVILIAFIVVFFRRQVFTPIKRVSAEATRFAAENTKGEPLSGISRFKEFDDLAQSIDTMETDMVNYMANLTVLTADKERVSTELSMAARIQTEMLPNTFPAFPDKPEFDIYAQMDPAREVGGDFYDYFLIDEDHVCLVIADVSGKGIPASLFMMRSKIIISDLAMVGKSPAEILKDANNRICDNNHLNMFVTVWLGILEISTGKLVAANAGHEYPVLKHADGKFEIVKDTHGFVLGGMEGLKYREYELDLEPGAKLFVYTDGVPEATDAENNMFGMDRLLDTLNSEPDANPEKVLGNVRAAVDGFVKDAEQFDDLTMLCVEYRGKDVARG